MTKHQDKTKKKNGVKLFRALGNNVYAVKLVGKMSPSRVVHEGISTIFGYTGWLFYSAFFMRYVISAMEAKKNFAEIMTFLGITVGVFAAMNIYDNYLAGKVRPITNVAVYRKLYYRLFKKARNVELSCYEDSEFYNRYTLAMDGAADKLTQTLSNVWGVLFGAIAAGVAFGVMYSIDAISMLFVIFPIVGNFVFDKTMMKLDFERNKEINPHNRRAEYVNRVMYLSEYAKEVRLTRVFSLMKKKYEEAIQGMIEVTGKYTIKGMIFHWLHVMFTFQFIFEGVLLYGAYRTIVSQTMSLAQLAVLSSVMVSATWILIGFANSLVSSFHNGLFVENLRSFLEYKPAVPEDTEGIHPGDTIESIEFRHVSFSYKDKEVIHDLSFEIRGGCSYAMVGHNGAGKSTIIKLLMRLYDPTEGEIYLNGVDIKEYNLQQYRALFTTAFQDYKIFAAPIVENVLMHRGSQEEEHKVENALKRTGVYDKVMTLPNGIHTVLTKEFDEDGAQLSGGEFQKIVVARAFVKDVPIKIFDEPSSALDPIAEYELFENILQDGEDKTMLFISHRLSSVQNADWVFMLEYGKIIEQGSHDDLMKTNGTYADMYRKQAKNYLALEVEQEVETA